MIEQIKKFIDFDFRLFLIESHLNQSNFLESNILKSPAFEREKRFDISDYSDSTTGVGLYLGHNSTYAIDIDGIMNYEHIKRILKDMKLPEDYPWVIQSGSKCGYHILFKTNLPKKKLKNTLDKIYDWNKLGERIPFGEYDVNAYYAHFPNITREAKIEPWFYKIEFLWTGELVLPPSIHSSGDSYSFVNSFPKQEPLEVDFESLSSSTWSYRNEQALRSQFVDYNGDPMRPYECDINVTELHSFKFALPDALNYTYQSKFEELSTIILYGQFAVKRNLLINQISWFVIDKNFNIKKRKSYNYFSEDKINSDFEISKINIDIASKICSVKRLIYFELLFDIEHTKKVVFWNKKQSDIIKTEILKSGLYLDAFFSKIRLKPDFVSKFKQIYRPDLKDDIEKEEKLLKKLNIIENKDSLLKKVDFVEELSCEKESKFRNNIDKKLFLKYLYNLKSFEIENTIKGLTMLYTVFLNSIDKKEYSE